MATNKLLSVLGEAHRPDCRYGHGYLTDINEIHGRGVRFMLNFSDEEARDMPAWITGLKWFLCPVCGYTELHDPEPQNTLQHARDANG